MLVKVYASELLSASKIAHANEGYNALHCVYVERNDDGYAIAATDSYRLVEFVNNDLNTFGDSVNGTVLISSAFIKANIKAADKDVVIETDDDTMMATLHIANKKGEVRTITTKASASQYPNYRTIIEKEYAMTSNAAIFNANFLKDVSECVSKAYGKDTPVKLEIANDAAPMMMTAYGNGNGKIRAVIMPKRSAK